jgi:hypothetical protein
MASPDSLQWTGSREVLPNPLFRIRPRGSHSDLRGRRRHFRCRHCRRQVLSHGGATAVAVNPDVAGAAAAAGGPAAIAGWSRVAVAGVPGIAVAHAVAPARVVHAVARVTSVVVESARCSCRYRCCRRRCRSPVRSRPGCRRRRCGDSRRSRCRRPAGAAGVAAAVAGARSGATRCLPSPLPRIGPALPPLEPSPPPLTAAAAPALHPVAAAATRGCRLPVRSPAGAVTGIPGVALPIPGPLPPRLPKFQLLLLPPPLRRPVRSSRCYRRHCRDSQLCSDALPAAPGPPPARRRCRLRR